MTNSADPVNKSYRVGAGLFSGAAAMTFPIVGAICNLLREYDYTIPESRETAWVEIIVIVLGLLSTFYSWWSKMREKNVNQLEANDHKN